MFFYSKSIYSKFMVVFETYESRNLRYPFAGGSRSGGALWAVRESICQITPELLFLLNVYVCYCLFMLLIIRSFMVGLTEVFDICG